MFNYKLFLEKLYNINLSDNSKTDYDYIKDHRDKYNRLKHLVFQIEQTGSPLEGEKISGVLLGATNLNTIDLAYPFVDLEVIDPINGITKDGEFISVKTSRDKHTLESAVSYVNGFKIGQLIQFAISKMDFKMYKTDDFKERNIMKLSSITSHFDKIGIELFKNDSATYTRFFTHSVLIYKILKDYLNYLLKKNDRIDNTKKLYNIIAIVIATFVDKQFNKNYTKDLITMLGLKNIERKRKTSEPTVLDAFNNRVNDFTKWYEQHGLNMNYIDPLDNIEFVEDIKDIEISYSILFFEKEAEGKNLVLNLYKTQSLPLKTLYKNSMNAWMTTKTVKKGSKTKELNEPFHIRKMQGSKENLYLDYHGVVKAFEGNGLSGDDVFNTHIKIEFGHDYKDKNLDTKKLYVKIIDKIKGIDTEDKETEVKILNLLNSYLDEINSGNKSRRDRVISDFSKMFPDHQI